MQEYFIRLFEYDHHANRQMLDLLKNTEKAEIPLGLLAHLLAAQEVWLARCQGTAISGGTVWPDWSLSRVEEKLETNNSAWMQWIRGLAATDFEKNISYKDLKGRPFQNRLSDILAHVINHGTHHRAQIGQQLKFMGLEKLPVTDYILYRRQQEAG